MSKIRALGSCEMARRFGAPRPASQCQPYSLSTLSVSVRRINVSGRASVAQSAIRRLHSIIPMGAGLCEQRGRWVLGGEGRLSFRDVQRREQARGRVREHER